MMKNTYININVVRWSRSILFLVLVCYSQVYPYYHLHHSHDQYLAKAIISFLPADVDGQHASDHHHHDRPQTIAEPVDWPLTRPHPYKAIPLENRYLVCSHVISLKNDQFLAEADNDEYFNLNEQLLVGPVSRGPPLFS